MQRAGWAVLAVSLAMVANSIAGAAQGLAPSAAISGVIVDAATQKPLAGAVVILQGTSNLAPAAAPSAPVSLTTRTTTDAEGRIVSTDLPRPDAFRGARQITDEQGRFVFTNLPGNMSYSLSASRFGFFDGAYGRRGVGTPTTARRISLVDGQWFRDARIELIRPSSITGTVIDEMGEPVVGVTVRTYAEIFVGGVRQVAGGLSVTTDDRGMFRLGNLTSGRYIVGVPSVQHAVPAGLTAAELAGMSPQAMAALEASGGDRTVRRDPSFAVDAAHRVILVANSPPPAPSAAGRPQVYPTTFFPSARTLVDASAIALQPGEDRQAVDIQLGPVPAFRISGRLDGPAEAIGGMSIRLMSAGSEGLGRGSESATALVGADGSFTFLNVANGSYTIIASRSVTEYNLRSSGPPVPSSPGSRFTSMSSSVVFSGPAGTSFSNYQVQGSQRFHGRQPVTVSGRDVNDLIVPLQPGLTMQGRFVIESAKPVATSPFGLRINAEPANGDASLGQPQSIRRPNEPAAMDFTIEGLRPGAYLLRMFGSSYLVKSITWNGKDYTETPFDTTGGRDMTDVVVTLTDQATTLSGAIRDRTGQPAGNTAVIVFPAERALWTHYGIQPARIRASTPSTGGTYSLRGMPAGDYLVVAVDDDAVERWKDPAFFEAASRVAIRVSMAWGETRTLDLVLQEVR